MARQGILEKLAEGPVLGDGGYLLELEKRGYVQAGPFTPEVSITHPSALAELHREFMYAGSEVLQTLTFYASEDKLATVGLADRLDDINRAATRIAREVADEGGVLVAGNISMTWAYEPDDPKAAARVRDSFDRQIAIMKAGGVDFIIGETYTWLGEALIAVEAIKESGLPAMVTMSYEQEPVSHEGYGPAECARRLIDAGADIVGVNCLRNPTHTLPLVQEMRDAVDGFIAAQPTAYRTTSNIINFTQLPEFPLSLDPLQLTRAEMADYALKAREMGVNYIGACCGTVAAHIKAMAKALGKLPEEERAWRSGGKAMSATEMHGHDEVQ
jgi:betaine-homocysteine S-methyltransferase